MLEESFHAAFTIRDLNALCGMLCLAAAPHESGFRVESDPRVGAPTPEKKGHGAPRASARCSKSQEAQPEALRVKSAPGQNQAGQTRTAAGLFCAPTSTRL